MTSNGYLEEMQALHTLVEEMEALPYPQIRARIFDLLERIDRVHRAPLTRLAALLDETVPAARIASDPLIRTLLQLYELRPVDGPPPDVGEGGTFIPISALGMAPEAPLFRVVATRSALPSESVLGLTVAERAVLLAHVEGQVVAYEGSCPGTMAPLHLGTFRPPVLLCPWHNEAWDLRSGMRADGQPGPPLTPIPVRLEGDEILIRLPAVARVDGAGGRS